MSLKDGHAFPFFVVCQSHFQLLLNKQHLNKQTKSLYILTHSVFLGGKWRKCPVFPDKTGSEKLTKITKSLHVGMNAQVHIYNCPLSISKDIGTPPSKILGRVPTLRPHICFPSSSPLPQLQDTFPLTGPYHLVILPLGTAPLCPPCLGHPFPSFTSRVSQPWQDWCLGLDNLRGGGRPVHCR